jgi:hypothetical protein
LNHTILQLTGKLEETIVAQGQRIAICETALFSSKNLKRRRIVKAGEAQPMTDQNADFAMKYRVTFTVQVTNRAAARESQGNGC